MPTINKLPKKEHKPLTDNTEHRLLRRKAYNNSKWRALRDCFVKEHPICEDCLKKGKVTPADSVHHLRSPFQNGTINYELLLDYDNLAALCTECHGLRHAKEGKLSAEDIIAQLDALFNDNITDKDIEQ